MTLSIYPTVLDSQGQEILLRKREVVLYLKVYFSKASIFRRAINAGSNTTHRNGSPRKSLMNEKAGVHSGVGLSESIHARGIAPRFCVVNVQVIDSLVVQ